MFTFFVDSCEFCIKICFNGQKYNVVPIICHMNCDFVRMDGQTDQHSPVLLKAQDLLYLFNLVYLRFGYYCLCAEGLY